MAQKNVNISDAQTAAGSPKRNPWGIVIQVVIAALTALAGVFTGCQMP